MASADKLIEKIGADAQADAEKILGRMPKKRKSSPGTSFYVISKSIKSTSARWLKKPA